MPSLFTTSLPPCGYVLQLAYQNVLHRFRRLHLQHPSTLILSLCTTVHSSLIAEESAQRAGTLALTGTRTPWRREIVLEYELRWAKYFVREAEVAEKWARWNKVQREKQDLVHRLYPVPKELGIIFRKRENTKGVHGLWMVWHGGKRADLKMEVDGEEAEGKAEEEKIGAEN